MKNRLLEIALTVCAVAVMVAVVWLTQGRSAPNADRGEHAANPMSASESASAWLSPWGWSGSEQEEDDVRNMPACIDLQHALGKLAQARQQLLHKAAQDHPESGQASQAYREAIAEVQQGFERLKQRVTPDQFELICEELLFNQPHNGYVAVNQWEHAGMWKGVE